MKIKKDDMVLVIAGKDKGKEGKVLRTISDKNRVVVEGVNTKVKHLKKTNEHAGQRVEYPGSMDISNVMLIDPKTKKRTRVGYVMDKNNKKMRVAKRSGEILASKSSSKPKAKVESKAKAK